MYVTTLLVYRYHLPAGYLSDGLTLVVADPKASKSSFIVDAKYWTKPLIGNFVHGASNQHWKEEKKKSSAEPFEL